MTADVRKGIIQDIRFYGDFFSEDDIQHLIDQLTGTPYNVQALQQKLAEININRYFNNVTRDEFLTLLTQ